MIFASFRRTFSCTAVSSGMSKSVVIWATSRRVGSSPRGGSTPIRELYLRNVENLIIGSMLCDIRDAAMEDLQPSLGSQLYVLWCCSGKAVLLLSARLGQANTPSHTGDEPTIMPGWVIWLCVDWCRPCYKYQKSLYSVKRMYGPDEVRGKQLL